MPYRIAVWQYSAIGIESAMCISSTLGSLAPSFSYTSYVRQAQWFRFVLCSEEEKRGHGGGCTVYCLSLSCTYVLTSIVETHESKAEVQIVA